MENGHLHDDKLFRSVHDRLSNYEAPANGADWDAMSRSLDALTKSPRFRFRLQWKISLNSILILIGVMGIAALGFALASHSTNSEESTGTDASVKQTPISVKNSVSNTDCLQRTMHQQLAIPVVKNEIASENTIAETSAITDSAHYSKTKKQNKKLLFGDQIDPRKGFIYNTQENSSVIEQPVIDPDPNVFYDSEKGTIKKIELKKDSSGIKSIIKPHHPADSTKSVAPTEGDLQGFDIGG